LKGFCKGFERRAGCFFYRAAETNFEIKFPPRFEFGSLGAHPSASHKQALALKNN